MKRIHNYILIGLLFFLFFETSAQQLRGYVYGIDSSKVIPLANLTNTTTQQKIIANRSGFFRINLSTEDSLTITAIGYETLTLTGKDLLPENLLDTIGIYMRPKAYLLKDVNIVYRDKRRDSIAQLAAEFLKTDPLLNNYDRVFNRPQGGIMSPLTALFNEYSKEGQDMKHFEEFVWHAEMLKQVNTRYNKKSIKRATGLSDEYLDDYILFCAIDRAFVLNASEYDLILSMRECAKRFREAKNID